MRTNRLRFKTETHVVIDSFVDEHPTLGYYSPDASAYIHLIPKNASSFLSGPLEEWEWVRRTKDSLIDLAMFSHALCLVRDPVSRWVSGITEFLYSINPDENFDEKEWKLLKKLMINQPNQEAHTTPQSEFLMDYPLEMFDYYFIPNHLSAGERLHSWFNGIGWPNQLHRATPQNVNDDSVIKREIYKTITNMLESDPEFKQAIKNYYQIDYELIEWIGRNDKWIK